MQSSLHHGVAYTQMFTPRCTSLRARKCWVVVREFSTSLSGPYRLLHLVAQWYDYRLQTQWTRFGKQISLAGIYGVLHITDFLILQSCCDC